MATMLGAARLANASVSTVPYTQRDAQPVFIATFGVSSLLAPRPVRFQREELNTR